MDGYWIYVIIGVVALVVGAGGVWYFMSRNQGKQLRNDLFDGEAYCVAIQKLRDSSNVLGKRKY